MKTLRITLSDNTEKTKKNLKIFMKLRLNVSPMKSKRKTIKSKKAITDSREQVKRGSLKSPDSSMKLVL